MIRLLLSSVLIALLLPSPPAMATKCPRGKVFSKKMLKCVARKIVTCRSGQYRERGRCVTFPYKKLVVPEKFVSKIGMGLFTTRDRRKLLHGIKLYKKQAYMSAIHYLKSLWTAKKVEPLGHLIAECYRRSGDYYHAHAMYKDLNIYFPKGTYAKLSQSLEKRLAPINPLRLKCQKLQMEACNKLRAIFKQEQKEGYHAGGTGVAEVNLYLGNGKRAKRSLLGLCKQGYLRACSALGWAHHKHGSDEVMALRYFKIACDGGGYWSCTLLGNFLEYELMKPQMALTYFKKACQQMEPTGCYQISRMALGKVITTHTAYTFFSKRCKKGNTLACIHGGGLAHRKLKRVQNALSLYTKGCSFDSTEACNKEGLIRLDELNDGVGASIPFRKACDEGDPEGCKNLARSYMAMKNYISAVAINKKYAAFFIKGCKAGKLESCDNLVSFYRNIVKSPNKAKEYARIAAKFREKLCRNGDTVSCYRLLGAYQGVLKDYKTALIYAKLLCKQKKYHACHTVSFLQKQLGMKVEAAKATKVYGSILEKQCDEGNLYSCLSVANTYSSKKQYKKAEVLLDRICKGGVEHACLSLAHLYAYYVNKPYKAISLYEAQCKKRHKEACNQLGLLLFHKLKNKPESMKWFDKSCRLDNVGACMRMALYYKKTGNKKLEQKAYRNTASIFARRCRKDDLSSCTAAGDIYKKNLNQSTKANTYYRKVARGYLKRCKKGEHRWCLYLANIYGEGMNKPAQAFKYYTLACKNNISNSCSQGARYAHTLTLHAKELEFYKLGCAHKNKYMCRKEKRFNRDHRR